MLSEEQSEKIRKQLIQHIAENFPEDKKEYAIHQIENMNSEQLAGFLKRNNLVGEVQSSQGCVFCSIVQGQIESYKIREDQDAIAVLEINPVTKGHTLVIPKEHHSSSDEVPGQIFSFAKEVAKDIKNRLKPKNVTISSSNLFGHEIINLVPVYSDEEPKERHKTNPEELKNLQEILRKVKSPAKPKTKKTVSSKNIRLPKRIP